MKEPEDDILKNFGFEDDEFLRDALREIKNIKKPVTTKEQAWDRFEQSLNFKSEVVNKSRFTIPLAWKIAASIVIILSVGIIFRMWNNVNISTSNNQIVIITLPDNSKVTLNAASRISYHKFRFSSSRNINLSGEALFTVTKGEKFEIISLGKTISVLGTELNVYSRTSYFEVKCLSGKVAILIPGNEKQFLTKGQGLKHEVTQKNISRFNVTSEAAPWIRGNFYFQDADFNLVADELGRQFNVKIKKTNVDRRYTGYFNKSKLTDALNSICLPMGLNYTIANDSVYIK